jgi:hypothetical protein
MVEFHTLSVHGHIQIADLAILSKDLIEMLFRHILRKLLYNNLIG